MLSLSPEAQPRPHVLISQTLALYTVKFEIQSLLTNSIAPISEFKLLFISEQISCRGTVNELHTLPDWCSHSEEDIRFIDPSSASSAFSTLYSQKMEVFFLFISLEKARKLIWHIQSKFLERNITSMGCIPWHLFSTHTCFESRIYIYIFTWKWEDSLPKHITAPHACQSLSVKFLN
jgi:hypothetical protein